MVPPSAARISGRELGLLVAMSTATDRTSGFCMAGAKYLGELMGVSRQRVRQLLPKLVDRDLIRDTGMKGPHGVMVWEVAPYRPAETSDGTPKAATYQDDAHVPDGRAGEVRRQDLAPQMAGPREGNGHIRSSDSIHKELGEAPPKIGGVLDTEPKQQPGQEPFTLTDEQRRRFGGTPKPSPKEGHEDNGKADPTLVAGDVEEVEIEARTGNT